MTDLPKIGVLIATVHRPGDVLVAVESVLASDYPNFEIQIVDQNADVSSHEALQQLLENPDVHYTRHVQGGLSAALNAGAGRTDAEILAITGDDCTVSRRWLHEMSVAFDTYPNAGVLFGSVLSAAYDREDGFVPGCVLSETVLIRDIDEIDRLSGTTANMGLRRSVWETLNGFDEALGVGAPFRSAEDLDLTLRALAAGHGVLQIQVVETTHHSPTLWSDRVQTIRRNWYGSGAAMAKTLKLHPGRMLRALMRLGRRWIRGGSEVAATYGPKPDRWSMLIGFGTGFLSGLFRRIDPHTKHFR